MLLAITGLPAQAQMFSVNERPGSRVIPLTSAYIGIEPAQFEARNALSDRFEFTGPVLRLRFETPGLNLFLATGGKVTGVDEVSYFDAGVRLDFGIPVLRREGVMVMIPLQVMTNITGVTNQNIVGVNTQFSQGGLTGGGGLEIGVRLLERLRLRANLTPSYGFAFSTGNTFGGSLSMLEGQARFYIDRVFGTLGLTFGYDYTFRRYDISANEFDYDYKSHSILAGITF